MAGCKDIKTDFSTATAELFDPATSKWSQIRSMLGARANHTATLLPNGYVLVVGGWPGSGDASAEYYDPSTGTWTATDLVYFPRDRQSATLLKDGRVLVAGGWYEGAQTVSELASCRSG